MQYIAYYRVSTQRQGQSGLGLEAQQHAVQGYDIISEYTEVESGKRNSRPQLEAALAECKRTGAGILIAKIDRLSRDAGFLFTLKNSGVQIKAADMPNAGTLEFGIRAVFAQHEAEIISERTKAGLEAAKRRGTKLGSPDPSKGGAATANLRKAATAKVAPQAMPVIKALRSAGQSLRAIASALNEAQIPTAMGGKWYASSVRNLINA